MDTKFECSGCQKPRKVIIQDYAKEMGSPYGCLFNITTNCGAWEEVEEEEKNLISGQYNELLMAVSRKMPGQTRHETALDCIRFAEKIYMVGKQLEGRKEESNCEPEKKTITMMKL